MGGTRRVPARATITVTYRRHEELRFWMPAEMQERYDYPRDSASREIIAGNARYSGVRPFDPRRLAPAKPVAPIEPRER
jgi:hypothetical protein